MLVLVAKLGRIVVRACVAYYSEPHVVKFGYVERKVNAVKREYWRTTRYLNMLYDFQDVGRSVTAPP